MSEKIKVDSLSRRSALSLLGGILGIAALAVKEFEADAQETTPAPAPSTGGAGTPGMKRRQQRRAGRHARRHERRTGQPAAPAATPPQ